MEVPIFHVIRYLKSVVTNLDSDLVILPSNIHEIMILRADDKTATFDEFANSVKEVNSTQVSAGDFLGDNCYLYSRKTGKIEIAVYIRLCCTFAM